jgi:hypothetical protein
MKRFNRGVKAGFSIKFCLPMTAALILQLPAQAQSYSYLPYALGSTLFYGLRWLAPMGTGYASPLWYGGNIFRQSTRGLGGNGYNGYSAYGNPNFGAINNDEDAGSPNVIRYGPPAVSGSNSSASQNQNSGSATQPAWNPNSGRFPPYYMPAAANPALFQPTTAPQAYLSGSTPGTVAYGTPMSAPHGMVGQPLGAPYQPGGTSGGSKHASESSGISHGHGKNGEAPLAVSFLNSINADYDGDIRKALANPGTRSWAQCLGVLPKGHKATTLTDSRANSINAVLHDDSLDPVSKLDTLKILLKQ